MGQNDGRKVTPEMIERMKKLREGGLSYKGIADKLKLNTTTVYNCLKEKKEVRFIERLKRFLKPPKRVVVPHKPNVYFQIILVLIVASSVLIIPTADKATFYKDKQIEYKRNAEDAIDDNAKTFWGDLAKRFEDKAGGVALAFFFLSSCAVSSVLGIMFYLDKVKFKYFEYAVRLSLALFLVSLILLAYSIIA